MANTIVVVSNTGRLVNVTGTNSESNSRYAKFAARLLGDDGSKAVLNYGWNGKNSLTITGASGAGAQITLDASEVVVPGTLTVNGKSIQEVIDDSLDLAMSGVVGTPGEIDIDVTDNPSAGTPGQPAKIYTISLSADMVDRIESLESIISGIIRFDDVYRIGDGLIVDEDYLGKILNVRLGYGLKFVTIDGSDDDPEGSADSASTSDSGESGDAGEDSDVDPDPMPKPRKIRAISLDPDIIAPRYAIEQNGLGNIVLYDTEEEDS